MYLLDTNVVSEARRTSVQAVSWLRSVDPESVHLSVITLGEITRGIVMRRKTDPMAASTLSSWLQALRRDYGARVLPITAEVALEWGRLSARRSRGDADGLIAATASVHRFAVVTRNVVDFADAGVEVINPWDVA